MNWIHLEISAYIQMMIFFIENPTTIPETTGIFQKKHIMDH